MGRKRRAGPGLPLNAPQCCDRHSHRKGTLVFEIESKWVEIEQKKVFACRFGMSSKVSQTPNASAPVNLDCR